MRASLMSAPQHDAIERDMVTFLKEFNIKRLFLAQTLSALGQVPALRARLTTNILFAEAI